jgi:hypothetical protein
VLRRIGQIELERAAQRALEEEEKAEQMRLVEEQRWMVSRMQQG